MKHLGLARYPSGLWTVWISLGKFRVVLKKNRTWILLECWGPTRCLTIETGFSTFPGFRVRLWRTA